MISITSTQAKVIMGALIRAIDETDEIDGEDWIAAWCKVVNYLGEQLEPGEAVQYSVGYYMEG